MNRRGFLGAILAAGMAPAVVRAVSLMKLTPSGLLVPEDDIFAPILYTGESGKQYMHYAFGSDGAFDVVCNFSPAWTNGAEMVITKRKDAPGDWMVKRADGVPQSLVMVEERVREIHSVPAGAEQFTLRKSR